jgi:hypothetical protein
VSFVNPKKLGRISVSKMSIVVPNKRHQGVLHDTGRTKNAGQHGEVSTHQLTVPVHSLSAGSGV